MNQGKYCPVQAVYLANTSIPKANNDTGTTPPAPHLPTHMPPHEQLHGLCTCVPTINTNEPTEDGVLILE